MRTIAGSGQPIGFGGRYAALGRVRPPSETPASPDTYPLGYVGLVRMTNQHNGPAVVQGLIRMPAPLTPADGGSVAPGKVRLVARNVADTSVKYVFEIEGGATERETSAPIAAGQRETAWSPNLEIRSGQPYTWRVWTVSDNWRGAAATASFRGR